jgi:hypothetical protein
LSISFFFKLLQWKEPLTRPHSIGEANTSQNQIAGYPKLQLPHLRRSSPAHSSKTFGAVACYEMDAIPYRICSLRAGYPGTYLAVPSAAEERS